MSHAPPRQGPLNHYIEGRTTELKIYVWDYAVVQPDNLHTTNVCQDNMSSIGPKDPIGFEFDKLIFSSDICKITTAESSTDTTGTCTTSTDFKIHTALLASLSPELKKYLENEMKEGLLGTVVLKEVDEDTILRFLQWAHRGTYSVPV